MRQQSMYFTARVGEKLADVRLQANLRKVKDNFVHGYAAAKVDYNQEADFEALRTAGAAIRKRVLDNLDIWLEIFEQNAAARGASVLWARDGREVCEHVVNIARQHGVSKAVKSKSMLSEEAGLNAALSAAGIQALETDLGEYILQIAGNEAPSHIIAPAMHKNLDEVADLFAKTHHTPRKSGIDELAREAREVLREHFLNAEMGITGGNFLIAESGSVVLVSNEGNVRMATTIPRVHVVITGIEKLVPTLEDMATLLRLLTRSATGQSISNYVSLLGGSGDRADPDGTQHRAFILVDNGRAGMLGSELQTMLHCIRCAACMNHCPVFQSIGGQAYGWVYPGPMGSILTPMFTGLENALELPQTSTLCNQCGDVCPVRIPLPGLLRTLREKQTVQGLRPFRERALLRAWAWLAERPGYYALATRIARRYLAWLAGGRDRIHHLAVAPGWSKGRDFPAPQGRTFRDAYASQHRTHCKGP